MKKLIILILLLAAFLTPSCIPGTPDTPGGQPETIEIGKTITTDIRRYNVSEFSYCGRRYLLVESPGYHSFEIIPVL